MRSNLTYANVVATIALFVALGGTGYAAVTITGKNVKNSSLTGADVKNSSLSGSDVKDRSLAARDFKAGQLPVGARGAAGPPGPSGAKGDQGPKGDIGPSEVLRGNALAATIAPGVAREVSALDLPSGAFAVWASITILPESGPASLNCELRGAGVLRRQSRNVAAAEPQTFVFQTATPNSSSSRLSLFCSSTSGGTVDAGDAGSITALRVGSVTDPPPSR